MYSIDEHMVYVSGFKAGLEAAAEYHTRRANEWQMCITEAYHSVDRSMLWPNVRNHQRYAEHIRNLKVRSNQDGNTDRDGDPGQEDPPQEGPQDGPADQKYGG